VKAVLQRGITLALLLCVIGLLAVLSTRHARVMDWTANARNSLSSASLELLDRMPEPILVQAFVDDTRALREGIAQLIERYQRHRPALQLQFVDPAVSPRLAEEAGIHANGTLLIRYGGRSEQVTRLSERAVSGALNRLARAGSRWIAYLQGEGQRDLLGEARTDLGRFGEHLRNLGYRLRPVRLAEGGDIPDNASLLVVLEPATHPVPGSLEPLLRYVDRGGNLLWLSDARHDDALAPLEARLGVRREHGLLVDPSSELYGRRTPEFIIVNAYAGHALTAGLDSMSAFPTATSLAWESVQGWSAKGIAASSLSSWLETGDLDAAVRFDDGADLPGPLDLAVALQRTLPDGRQQRAVVVGDADFLSNAYLGLAGNKALGQAAVDWLSNVDALLDVASPGAPDLDFAPSSMARVLIALVTPVLLPLLIVVTGLVGWRRRRAR
jgi:ABC-type uncharacterized transport system involved in gliding motility auxiliary subunit